MSDGYIAGDIKLTIDGEHIGDIDELDLHREASDLPGHVSRPLWGGATESIEFEFSIPVNDLARAAATEQERRILAKLARGEMSLVIAEDVAEALNGETGHPLFPYAYPGVHVREEMEDGEALMTGDPIEIARDPWNLFSAEGGFIEEDVL